MTEGDSRFWHPFAEMGAVRHDEFVVDRADDVWIWDEAGNRYLDGTAALWYANVGHGRQEIADAVARQMSRLEAYSTFGDFANRPAMELAERLSGLAPGGEWRVFFGSGGGDGVDTSLKIARRYFDAIGHPERTAFISRSNGYHGTHGWGTAVGGIPANRAGFGPPVAETVQVAHDSLDALAGAFDAVGGDRVAAVIAEPVIGAGGLYPPAPGYLEGAQELCHEHGALFIGDSVISGFGRLGTWFGVERFGLEPDMIIFAKGVTSGYLPLGGVMVSDRVAEPFFRAGGPVLRHGPTYAGHPACCAAALANLAIIEREGLLDRAREFEGPLLAALDSLTDYPLVAGTRGGVGLLAALEFSPDVLAENPTVIAQVFKRARELGVIVRPLGTALALSPPLTIKQEHIDQIAETLGRALADVSAQLYSSAGSGEA